MLHILKSLFRPLKTEYLMILLGMKTVVMILTVCWLLVAANAIAADTQQQHQHQHEQQQQPQTLNYKQQLQYQMQQHDKYQYQQQHIKQQQQYYQQQQHQQAPISMTSEQQQQQQQYLSVKPTQMLQTTASLVVGDGRQAEAFALEQPEFSNGNGQRRRPGLRKRKRRPQLSNDEALNNPTASNSPPAYWRGHAEDSKDIINTPFKSPSTKHHGIEEADVRPSLQASFKRRKQPPIREPLAPVVPEDEQKLYDVRYKPETPLSDEKSNSNSANLKNILKNNGGLSLSEILQQKNLSLDDLLKGKQNALQALQTTSATAPLEKINHAKYGSFKANYKTNSPNIKVAEENSEEVYSSSKERFKWSALHRLKLFGSSSRPTGSQVGLADHLTTRKREGGLYSTSTAATTTTTTMKPTTTKIPLYKKILHQRPTLKPTFLLKNTGIMASAEAERVVTSWDSKEMEEIEHDDKVEEGNESEEVVEDIELTDDEEDLKQEVQDVQVLSTQLPEITTWRMITTMHPSTSTAYSTTTSTTSTSKPTTEKSTNIDRSTSTRRMFISTRGSGRTTYRYSSSTSNPATTSTTSTTTTTTTTTPLPMTTTSPTSSTTTASSSTMNLTPKANLNLNTEDLRERIQETLLKNLIEKEHSYKKSTLMETHENANNNDDNDDDDDLENFFEDTVKPKTTKYIETSTITTRMKQYTPSFIYTSSSTSTTSSPTTFTTPTENSNVIPDFDNVDDRTDLLELIEDRRSGNRLFKVLEQRNMTLEELIEHRKRGSSQLHLATIVESPSRFYPDKKVVLQDNMDIVTAFENFPHFNLLNLKSVKPDDIKTDSQGSSYFTSIIDIEPTDEVYKNRKGAQAISADLDKASLLADRSEKSLGFFPSWKTLALASLATPKNNNKDTDHIRNTNMDPYFLQQPKMLLENNSENNENDDEDLYDIKENELSLINRNDNDDDDDNDGSEDDYQAQNPIQAAVRLPDQTVEDIENEVARAHDLVDLELSGHGFKRSPQAAGAMAHSHRRGSFYTNMPPGIKSAIVASATIVLTALVTFMVIFAVCKWKQRRHRMTNIMKSYNAMKNKLPTIASTSTAALNAISRTNPNSRRSSFREMQDLLGGSGLSVAATITTTSTGVPNTPIHTTKTSSISPVNVSQTTTTTTLSADHCSKNINSIYGHHHNNNNNNNINSGSNSSNSYGLRPLQRQSSLLFQRSFNQNSNSNNNINNHNEKPTNLSILSGCNLLDLNRNNKMNGSTTSLSFSLTSGHNISNSHINTMDANSPEVQEYLFDTLRNSF